MFDKYLKGRNSFGMPNAVATFMRTFMGFMVVALLVLLSILCGLVVQSIGVGWTLTILGVAIVSVPVAYLIGSQILVE